MNLTPEERRAWLPQTLPPGWTTVELREDGEMYAHRGYRASVIASVAREADGRPWLHVSLALRDRMPTWTEMVRLKEWAVGPERYAYQVHAPPEQHVNLHEFCLHLWSPLEGDPPLPDFTQGGQSI